MAPVSRVHDASRADVAAAVTDLDAAQRDVQRAREENLVERRRLHRLRVRLRQRVHRHWLALEAQARHQKNSLVRAAAENENESRRLRKDREDFELLRQQYYAEIEIGRREVQASRQELEGHWAYVQGQADEVALAQIQVQEERQRLDADKRAWAEEGARRAKEERGLESRIEAKRTKLRDWERKQEELQTASARAIPAAVAFAAPLAEPAPRHDDQAAELDSIMNGEVVRLEAIEGELADHRLQLAEQWQRLLAAQHEWEQERAQAAGELTALSENLDRRAQALTTEQARIQRRQLDLERRQRHAEGRQAQAQKQLANWKSERELVLADVRSREALLEQRWAQLGELRCRWQERYEEAAERLKAEYARCERLRDELAAHLQTWLASAAQRPEPQAGAPIDFDRILEDYQALIAKDNADRADRSVHLRTWAAELAGREKELVNLRTTWEFARAVGEQEAQELRTDCQRLRTRQAVYERQLAALNDELERLARGMLNEEELATAPLSVAA